jgi:multicomponent Na+:H+ antiporter subunit D
MRAHLPILPVLVPLLGGMLQPVIGYAGARAAFPLALATAAATLLAAGSGALEAIETGARRYFVGSWEPPWGIEVVLDPLSAFTATLVAAVATLALLGGKALVERAAGREAPAHYALALLFLAGLEGMVVSGDLFNVFVFLEVASISAYALVASGGGPALAAAFRYLLLGTVGASFYLLGVGCLYAATGTLNMADVAARAPAVSGSPLLAGGIAFLVAGLGVKMALFPLHTWLPETYGRASAPVVLLLAPIGTKAAAYVLARVLLYVVHPESSLPTQLLAWVGALAIVYGGARAIAETDARRLLAWSSVSQLGYVALGLGLASAPGLVGAYLQLAADALAKGVLFAALGVTALAGASPALARLRQGRALPIAFACSVVAALSLVGVPPTAGFFAKWYLLQGAVAAGEPALAAVVVGGGLLAIAYTYRFASALRGGERGEAQPAPEAPVELLAALVALALLVVAVGTLSAPLVERLLVPAAAGALR